MNKNVPRETTKIIWSEVIVRVDELKPYEGNPRHISETSFKRLKAAISELGFHQRILCQPDRTVIGGHQRIKALLELGIAEVQCLIPSRPLTAHEFKRLLIQDNLPFGEFDMEMIANDFSRGDLVNWGFPPVWNDKAPAGGANDEGEPVLGDLKYCVIVECQDETHQAQILEKFMQDGYKCKALIS